MADVQESRSLAAGSTGGQRATHLHKTHELTRGGVSKLLLGRQTFLFGCGASAESLGDELGRRDSRRVGVICNRSVALGGQLEQVVDRALGSFTIAAHLEAVGPGVPEHETEALATKWRPLGLDTLVAIGGGAAIDTAKALSLLLSERGGTLADEFVGPGEIRDYSDARFPLIVAIPTTLSGAEVTGSAGILSEGGKRLIRVEQVTPSVVCCDPSVVVRTPVGLLKSTGFCALAHAAEAVYATRRNPASTALALRAAQLLGAGIPSLRDPVSVTEGAAELLSNGATLAALALKNCSSALQHVICQVLGGSFGIPHGVAHAIMLPAVLRFNWPSSRLEQEELGYALGNWCDNAPSDLASQIEDLRIVIGAPSSLREAGLSKESLIACARRTFQHPGLRDNPRLITSEEEVLSILGAAW